MKGKETAGRRSRPQGQGVSLLYPAALVRPPDDALHEGNGTHGVTGHEENSNGHGAAAAVGRHAQAPAEGGRGNHYLETVKFSCSVLHVLVSAIPVRHAHVDIRQRMQCRKQSTCTHTRNTQIAPETC